MNFDGGFARTETIWVPSVCLIVALIESGDSAQCPCDWNDAFEIAIRYLSFAKQLKRSLQR
jgi:hypothetical protein